MNQPRAIMLLFLALAGACILAPPARAFDLIRRSLPELARGASLIFIGRCETISCHWNADHTLILTSNRFRVERVLKGAPGATITLDELGGVVGDQRLSVADMPRYRVGEEVLLCAHSTELGRWVTYGGGQGRFEIERDTRGRPWVRSDFYPSELAALSPEGRGAGYAPLAEFAGHLQALAANGKVRP